MTIGQPGRADGDAGVFSFSRLPAPSKGHRHRRGLGFEPGRLGQGHLREPRILRFPGQALSGEPEAPRAVGPTGLSQLRRHSRTGRSRARDHSVVRSSPIRSPRAPPMASNARSSMPRSSARAATRRACAARRRSKALCDKHGLRISGPNCMGSVALREKLLLYPAKRVRALRPGPVGVVFQSGGTFQFWLQQASLRGLDFSYAVSSGNELDLDLADYISFLVDDEHTKIIVCLVEGVRRPTAFMAAAEKALAAEKPIILLKVGPQRARQGGDREPYRRARQRRPGVRRGLPQIRHRALPVARRSPGDLPRLPAGAAAARARASPWSAIRAAPRGSCSTMRATKARRWRR